MPRAKASNGHTSPKALWSSFIDPIASNQRNQLVGNATSLRSHFMEGLLDPRRDIDDECGYPKSETGTGVGSFNPDLYRMLYEREAIATRVVQVMPRECWQVTPEVYEDPSTENVTDFEEAWDELEVNMSGIQSYHRDEIGGTIWEHLLRADILSGIGHFGIILLGIDDGKNLQDPVDAVVQNARADCEPLKREVEALQAMVANKSITVNSMREGADGWQPVTTTHSVDYLNDWRPTENKLKALVEKSGGKTDGLFAWFPSQPMAESFVSNARFAGHVVSNVLANDAWGSGMMGAVPQKSQVTGTDAQYASSGAMPPAALSGTDQQYFGVQFGPSEQFGPKPSKKETKLLFMRAFDESLVQVVRYEWSVRNPRFGQPVMYRVTLNDPREQHSGVGLPMATVFVHWSRVIHLADNLGSSEIFGVPRMRPVLNRLLDLRKLYSGSAEMYWRGAFPGLSLETHPQLGGDVDVDSSILQDTMEQYMNGLQRYLLLMGMSAKTLAPAVVDPTPQINTQIEAVCIQLGIPKRVFCGSERGELASNQDDASWNDRLKHRQNLYITPKIIVPFVDRLIYLGVLPEPKDNGQKIVDNMVRNGWKATKQKTGGWLLVNESDDSEEPGKTVDVGEGGFTVEWPDLDSNTDKDKAMIAFQRTQAMAAYAGGNVESLLPPMDYLTHELGFTEEEATAILDNAQKHLEEVHPEEDNVVPGHGPAEKPEPPPGMMIGDDGKPTPLPQPPGAPVKLNPGQTLHPPDGGKPIASGNPMPKPKPTANEQAAELIRNLHARVAEQEFQLNQQQGQQLDPSEVADIIMEALK
jgi:hypothetical protein